MPEFDIVQTFNTIGAAMLIAIFAPMAIIPLLLWIDFRDGRRETRIWKDQP